MRNLAQASCSVLLPEGDDLPTEFCLFTPGENPNVNNEIKCQPQPVLTPRSVESLRKEAERKGTDYMADLEHASIDKEACRLRSDACDAMAWYNLDFRADGSVWAVNVRWSDEGARRLRAKLQRYISPVFLFHRDTGEILKFVNVALTSDPATYGIAPLVAASRLAPVNDHATPAALAERTAVAVAVAKALRKIKR